MIGLGLSAAQLKSYSTALRHDHTLRCRVTILDGNEQHQAEVQVGTTEDKRIPISIIGGQVDIDTTQGKTAPWRKLTLALLDPKAKLQVQRSAPTGYALWANSFVRVERGDYDPARNVFVYCPVFTGPLMSVERVNPEVTIICAGKEVLAQPPYGLLNSVTVTRGMKVSTAIHNLLDPIGEANYGFVRGSGTATLSHDITVPQFAAPWSYCMELARLANLVLFYDGRGTLRLEDKSAKTNTVWQFYGDTGISDPNKAGMLLSAPDLTHDFTKFRNYVDVKGAPPTATVPQPHSAVSAAGGNDLSPLALARNGAPRYAFETINDSQIASQADADTRATTEFKILSEISTDAKFEVMPVPHIEEKDWVQFETLNGTIVSAQMNVWSIPLGPDTMPIGVLRQMRYTTQLRHRRVKRKHLKKKTHHSSKKHK